MDNVEEMDKFLEKYNFPKLDREEIIYKEEVLFRITIFMIHRLCATSQENSQQVFTGTILRRDSMHITI